MMVLLAAGVAALVAIAIVVTVVDLARAPAWREIAAQRRRAWEEGRTAGPAADLSDLPGPQ